MTRPGPGLVLVGRQDLALELAVGDLEDGAEPVRRGLVRPEDPERLHVPGDHVAEEGAQDPGRLARRRAGGGHVDRVVAEVGQVEVAQEQPAVGVRVGAHPAIAPRRQLGELRDERAVLVEQLLGPVAAQPGLEQGQVGRVRPDLGERHLVRSPGPLDREPVDLLRAGPALGRPEDDHRPGRPVGDPAGPGRGLDRGGSRGCTASSVAAIAWCMVGRVVARHEVRPVAVALHERAELVLGDPGQDRRVGDLVAVEVEDRQDGAVVDRVEELVRVPARGERPGLRLAVADDAADDEIRVVEGGAVGVGERVAELAALVDRARRLGRHVAGDAARERELAEQLAQPVRRRGRCSGRPRCRCPRGRRSRRGRVRRVPGR